MNADLGQFPDGAFVLACDDPLPHAIKRVEYYKDQRLMMLVYDDPEHEGDLMNCELCDDVAKSFEKNASDLTIISNATSDYAEIYRAPIIQVGV
jgi:hypothetical protein